MIACSLEFDSSSGNLGIPIALYIADYKNHVQFQVLMNNNFTKMENNTTILLPWNALGVATWIAK